MIPWVDKVMGALLAKTVPDKHFDNRPYERHIIHKEDADIIRTILVEGSVEQLKEFESKVAALEAKVFVYENIIRKSNFALVLEEKTGEQGWADEYHETC